MSSYSTSPAIASCQLLPSAPDTSCARGSPESLSHSYDAATLLQRGTVYRDMSQGAHRTEIRCQGSLEKTCATDVVAGQIHFCGWCALAGARSMDGTGFARDRSVQALFRQHVASLTIIW
jgi:hypothetical protein